MVYIGCTAKLAKAFDGRLSANETSFQTGIHGWHANLYHFYRRKSVLAVNDETRFAIFLPGLRKPDFLNFDGLFRARFKQELLRFGVSHGAAAKVLLALGPVTFGKTHNRSVLGSMNDMAFCMEIQMQRLDGLPENDNEMGWVSRSINEMPCRSKEHPGFFTPAEEMRRLASEI